LIRAALERLQGRAVLITTADDVPVTSGRLVAVEGMDGPVLPSLTMEFSLRGIVFAMEIPLERVFRMVSSWNGRHFVYRLPPNARLEIEPARG
jgi:hypothetical protein